MLYMVYVWYIPYIYHVYYIFRYMYGIYHTYTLYIELFICFSFSYVWYIPYISYHTYTTGKNRGSRCSDSRPPLAVPTGTVTVTVCRCPVAAVTRSPWHCHPGTVTVSDHPGRRDGSWPLTRRPAGPRRPPARPV
jgi:hypothetical protein